jgi:hypothetical protein
MCSMYHLGRTHKFNNVGCLHDVTSAVSTRGLEDAPLGNFHFRLHAPLGNIEVYRHSPFSVCYAEVTGATTQS